MATLRHNDLHLGDSAHIALHCGHDLVASASQVWVVVGHEESVAADLGWTERGGRPDHSAHTLGEW